MIASMRHPAKRKIHLGLAPRHDIGNRAPRAAAHGPAQGAVAGIEEQVGKAGLADIRQIGRRERPQPGPVERIPIATTNASALSI